MGTLIAVSDEALASLIADLTQRGLTIATAELLTGGGLVARLVDVPGASHVVRGGACTCVVDTKASTLGVSEGQLAAMGPVNEQVVHQMARGARELFRADIGVSTTGVAGPGPVDGFPAGTVHVACTYPAGEEHRLLHLDGQRAAVRAGTIDAAIALVHNVLDLAGAQVDN